MPRSTTSKTRLRRKAWVKRASGHVGRASSCYKLARMRVEKGMQYQYRDRKNKKRDLKSLWIQRINAFARENGTRYSSLIARLSKSEINIDRKTFAYLAYYNPSMLKSLLFDYKII